ncbi:ABC transporter ATP-binding protein [Commensalibacter nepenthis]|uniref:Nitrate/sulfonate/bicarbonate ABC transporter ATP-binding protein n=1 Tax=Commensalibacter nepenthis TaxID=3043872 RepID=A0ABT6QA33_9PROT|nr:nitrate/sulfonate/bicarbonate ABC transporter ATP-binding protein [Commensalibacter sp. TBRC 10068]MDI2113771.1 nitrate/sulfonate/bicarbonate ABC transporter ATP-binding protein [Commensalibacter sp. TBRC 10068]
MNTLNTAETLIEVKNCKQSYPKENHSELVVLDDVNVTLKSGEIVGLLGRSGSGKSTLLRIVAGLLAPTKGEVRWKDQLLSGPAEGIAMVFQSFALFPWLTVQDNVQLGLEAKGVHRKEQEQLAEEAIDLIGLGGYEKAYPKELSGGMRQRVGLARALVVHPDLLLMDEPFSALDVLTAENLRTDLIELWVEKKLPVKSILIVTHSIEEAVLMCDRLLIFSSNPGSVAHELEVTFPHPRNREDIAFRQLVDKIYTLMTHRGPAKINPNDLDVKKANSSQFVAIPPMSMNLMIGMVEALLAEPYMGRADLPKLAQSLQMELDDLLPIGETLQMLGFADMAEGDIILTELGKELVHSEIEERKDIFRRSVVKNVTLIRAIRSVLDERSNHKASAERFRDELKDTMSPEYARQTLSTVIGWARYAEIFDFDEESDQFFLDEDDKTVKE